jgi:hypothetical protein
MTSIEFIGSLPSWYEKIGAKACEVIQKNFPVTKTIHLFADKNCDYLKDQYTVAVFKVKPKLSNDQHQEVAA